MKHYNVVTTSTESSTELFATHGAATSLILPMNFVVVNSLCLPV